MRKVVFITNAMLFGGAERVIATLSNHFVNKGIDVSIITIMNTACEFDLDNRIKCYSVYDKKGKPSTKQYIHYYGILKEKVREENPDIIVIMPEEISVKAIPFLYKLNIPIVVSERNNPWVMPKNKLNRILRKIYYKKVDGIVFQTKVARSFFSKRLQENSKVILNPLNCSKLPNEHTGERRKVIANVGRLTPQKNQKLLIKAFSMIQKKHGEYKLVIYGNGELREELVEYANSLLPADTYEIKSATKEILDRINDADMFVLTSDYEGLPNVLIEAMALGLPCISTDCLSGGPRELIENRKNGILVETGDYEAIVSAIDEIIENRELADMLGKNAKKIRTRLDEEVIVKEWEDYFNEIINKK